LTQSWAPTMEKVGDSRHRLSKVSTNNARHPRTRNQHNSHRLGHPKINSQHSTTDNRQPYQTTTTDRYTRKTTPTADNQHQQPTTNTNNQQPTPTANNQHQQPKPTVKNQQEEIITAGRRGWKPLPLLLRFQTTIFL
jgi:hypothetical protein